MTAAFHDTIEYRSLIKGLGWVMRQQRPEGGWPNAPGEGPAAEATGHVLNVLIEMGCIDSKPVHRAFEWLNGIHIQQGDRIGWGRDIMLRVEDLWASTMLCATAMLNSKRKLPIGKELLSKTLMYEIDLLVHTNRIWDRLSFWVFLAAAKAIPLLSPSTGENLWDVLWRQIEDLRERDKTEWDTHQGETIKETAQVGMALLCFPSPDRQKRDHIATIVRYLVDKAHSDDNGIFWKEDIDRTKFFGSRRGTAFYTTRWCVLTLIEAKLHGFGLPVQEKVIKESIRWLISRQKKSDGCWQIPKEVPPGSSFCAYVLLPIFKWLHAGLEIDLNELRHSVLEEVMKLEKQYHLSNLAMRQNDKVKIFLSYAHEDYEEAKKLYDQLRANSYIDVWFDKESLSPGQTWAREIRKAIRSSRYFLLLLSINSTEKKGFYQREIREALKILEEYPDDEIYLVPVRLDRCKPHFEQLEALQYVDLFPDWATGFRRILKTLLKDKNESR